MPLFLRNFGLGFLERSQEAFFRIRRETVEEGRAIRGYYGVPYFNKRYGDVQMILRTVFREEKDRLEITGMDAHAAGGAVWEARLCGMKFRRGESDPLERRVVIKRPDGSGGIAVVSLVNGDVLPSFLEDDLIRIRVAAFPERIEYFPDADAYARAQPTLRNGRRFTLAEGTLYPAGLMRDRDPDSPESEPDGHLDGIVNIRGTVKALHRGRFEFGGEARDTFFRCVIDTEYGFLQIVHSAAQVRAAQREYMRVGATVNFCGTLSGDAAVLEYKNGIVRDEAHDLALVRDVICGGDPERLRSVLAEDVASLVEGRDSKTMYGAGRAIRGFQLAQKRDAEKRTALLGSVTAVDGEANAPAYRVGKRCLVTVSGERNRLRFITLIDTDASGEIAGIVMTTKPGCRIALDEIPVCKTPFDDVKFPGSAAEPTLLRARLQGVLDESVTDEQVLGCRDYAAVFEQNVRMMLDTMPLAVGERREALLADLYGYLFAKAVEMHYAESRPGGWFRKKPVCRCTPSDAWAGELRSGLDAQRHGRLEDAFHLGREFYRDFKFYREQAGGDGYAEELKRSLMLVQALGRFYSRKCLDW